MRTVTVNLPEELDDFISSLIEKKVFPNKSEFIRAAIRELLIRHESFLENEI